MENEGRLVQGDEERVLELLPVREPELNPVSEESRLTTVCRNTGSERTLWKLKSNSAIVAACLSLVSLLVRLDPTSGY